MERKKYCQKRKKQVREIIKQNIATLGILKKTDQTRI